MATNSNKKVIAIYEQLIDALGELEIPAVMSAELNEILLNHDEYVGPVLRRIRDQLRSR